MSQEKKKTAITVDSETLEKRLVDLFTFKARALDIPRGKLMSRALYLLLDEMGHVEPFVYGLRKEAQEKGIEYNDDYSLSKEEWLNKIPQLKRDGP